MIVAFSAEAEADLEEIGDYIALDSPNRAATFVTELVAACEQLAEMPHAFPLVPRYERFGIRRRPYGNYLVFYRVGAERIDVVHVLNAARDFERILFQQD